MGISSAAEAKLEASIRPAITVMRARTSYPRRHRPALTALPGAGSEAGARALPGGRAETGATASPGWFAGAAANDDIANAGTPDSAVAGQAGADDTPVVRVLATVAAPAPGSARAYRSAASFTSARTVRTATSATSVRTVRGPRTDRRAAPGRPATAAPRTPGQPTRSVRTSARPGRAGRHAATPPAGSVTARIRPPAGPAAPATPSRRAEPSAQAPARLTRRGRFVVAALAGFAIACAVSLIWLAVTGQAQAASKVTPGATGNHSMLRVVVSPGQTLWSIAEKADPSADPRLVIQQIVDDNALSGTAVNAGQVLWVPRF